MENSRASRDWINNEPLTIIEIGDIRFCLECRSVEVCRQRINLTNKEFDILALLIMNVNRVFTYEMIMDIVWNEKYDLYSRKTITNHISNIRKKLKITPDIPDYIKSIHSVGYKFDADII
ncbi:MAG: winged helix-turn-helix domain-containing protein [Candidatus Avoscillospira sp.]